MPIQLLSGAKPIWQVSAQRAAQSPPEMPSPRPGVKGKGQPVAFPWDSPASGPGLALNCLPAVRSNAAGGGWAGLGLFPLKYSGSFPACAMTAMLVGVPQCLGHQVSQPHGASFLPLPQVVTDD